MTELTIPEINQSLILRLREQASRHGRAAEAEARVILENALPPDSESIWMEVNLFREQLAGSGRVFSDSVALLREDRNR